jgi:enolase
VFTYNYLLLQLTGEQLAELYQEMIKEYPVESIEDAFDQDDWENWTKFQANMKIQLVGCVCLFCVFI